MAASTALCHFFSGTVAATAPPQPMLNPHWAYWRIPLALLLVELWAPGSEPNFTLLLLFTQSCGAKGWASDWL